MTDTDGLLGWMDVEGGRLLRLPWPPSTNSHWRAHNGRVLLSKAGRRYRIDSARFMGSPQPHDMRRCVVCGIATPPKNIVNRQWDTDNRIKPLQDAMEHHGLIVNDSLIDSVMLLREQGTWSQHGLVELVVYRIDAPEQTLPAAARALDLIRQYRVFQMNTDNLGRVSNG